MKTYADSYRMKKNKIARNKSKQENQKVYTSPRSVKFNLENQISEEQYEKMFYQTPQIHPNDIKLPIKRKFIIKKIQQFGIITVEIQQMVRRWLVNVYQLITSDAFQKYRKGCFSQTEMKIFTIKNYLFNIINLLKQINHIVKRDEINLKILAFLNRESKKILKHLILKYSSGKLTKYTQRYDYKDSQKYDALRYPQICGVEFFLREDGDYSKQIMKALNYMMSATNSPINKTQKISTFKGFDLMISSLLKFAGCKDFEQDLFKKTQKLTKINKKQIPGNITFQNLFFNYSEKIKAVQYDYIKQMQNQCNFTINQQIPSNVFIFTEDEINQKRFRLPSITVLQIMIKWSQQLVHKITNSEEKIAKSIQSFKNNKGELIQLTILQKQCLQRAAQQQAILIDNITQKLNNNLDLMTSKIFTDNSKTIYMNQDDGCIINCTIRMEYYIARHFFCYLNQVIHSLLKIPKRAEQIYTTEIHRQKLSIEQPLNTINLVSFTMCHLMEAKCQSSEKHTIEIYNLFQKLNEKCPQLIKIIAIQNIENVQKNVILFKLYFMDKIGCQIQISPKSLNLKNNHEYMLNNFLSQIQQSQLGPLREFGCILTKLDPFIQNIFHEQSSFMEIITPQNLQQSKISRFNINLKNNDSQKIKNIEDNLPFFCTSCLKFIKNINPQFYDRKIQNLAFKQCNQCYEAILKEDYERFIGQVLRKKYSKQQIKIFSKYFELIDPSKYKSLTELKSTLNKGIMVDKNRFHPIPQYFDTLELNSNFYVISYCDLQNPQYKIVFTINCKQQQWKKILSYKIIFNLKQKFNPTEIKTLSKIHQNNINSNNKQLQQLTKYLSINTQSKQSKSIESKIRIMLKVSICQDVKLNYKETLHLEKTIPQQLSTITQMKYVKNLVAYQNQITKMNFLTKIPNLQTIDLSLNNIIQIQALRHLKFLTKLSLENNRISKIQGLNELQSLTSLNLGNNQIQCIQGLDGLKSLKFLRLSSNKIQKIQKVEKLTCLNKLYLNNNLIKKIKGLEELKNLTMLDLGHNLIEQIQGIHGLTSLIFLNLVNNNIVIKNTEGKEHNYFTQLKQKIKRIQI